MTLRESCIQNMAHRLAFEENGDSTISGWDQIRAAAVLDALLDTLTEHNAIESDKLAVLRLPIEADR